MILITGYPGFLGTHLLEELRKEHKKPIALLVQDKFYQLAQRKLSLTELENVEVWIGDITQNKLCLENSHLQKITEVYHLAAVYDLSVKKELAYKINVEGTKNVVEAFKGSSQFQCLHYVSTCYVSGIYPGNFREESLIEGQKFHNHYEETKYLAEVYVREEMNQGFPAKIFRPGVVVGHSQTGETQKFDGPYFILQWILRYPILPKIGDYENHYVNIVPVDYVAKCIAYLSRKPDNVGKTYQLADPNPIKVSEFLDITEKLLQRRLRLLPLPKKLAKASLSYIPPIRTFMKINPDTIDYFVHDTTYDISNTLKDIEGSGIELPEIKEYMPKLLSFMKRKLADISSEAML